MGAGICQKVLNAHPRIRDCGTAAVLKNVTFLRMEHVPYLCITLANIAQVLPWGRLAQRKAGHCCACLP